MKDKILISVIIIFLIITVCFAGCTGDDDDKKEGSKTLVFYNYEDYLDPDLLEAFEKETGIKVTEEFFDSEDDMLSAVQSDTSKYDLVIASDYLVTQMRGLNLLSKLDKKEVGNLKNLDDAWTNPAYDPSSDYSVPYFYGTVGIAVDGSKVDIEADDFEESWSLLFPEDPATCGYSIGMLNSHREVIGSALKHLGYSINSQDAAQLEEAKQLLLEQAPHWTDIYSAMDLMTALEEGGVDVSLCYNGDAYVSMEENEDLYYFLPEEGGEVWVDCLVIPVDAQHKDAAYEFLDFLLDAENAAVNAEYVWYGSPVEAAYENIDTELTEDPAIFIPDSVWDDCEFLQDAGTATATYNQIWADVQSA